ncbi:serine protease [Uliginosibacterium sediminicola]|uniref:Serine protease n=1 Tax=Uliginosibacterium sediminicola TaxID=2024550 RepID=A0ABU9YYE6_9RHOO
MLKWFLTGLVSLGMVMPAWALDSDQLFRVLAPSVWLVRTLDRDGLPLGIGSAVVVSPKQLLSNCHVLKGAKSFLLVKEDVSFKGRLEQVDLERDMCLLAVSAPDFNAPAVALGDSDKVQVGTRVVALGNPRALELTFSEGLVSRLEKSERTGLLDKIQTSAPISPGSSGGGLFDAEGRLIGITQSALIQAGSQNLNFALPINWLKDLPARSAEQLAAYYAEQAKLRK